MTRIFVFEYLTGGGIAPDAASQSSLPDLSALIVEGRVMRDALVAELLALGDVQVTYAVSGFEQPNPAHACCCAQPGESLHEFVARSARANDYAWIVAPESDRLLLDLHDAVGPSRWLGCSRDAIALASSKRETAARLAAHGIDVTACVSPQSAASERAEGWVVKPDDGAGCLETLRFDRLEHACAEYEARVAAGRNPVLQPWIDGEPLSLSLICDEAGARLVSINRQCIALSGDGERDGSDDSGCDGSSGSDDTASAGGARVVEFDGVDVEHIDCRSADGRALDALAQRVAAAIPGLRGFVGIDVILHPQRGPVVVEVNPRVTVAYAGLAARHKPLLTDALLRAHGVRRPAQRSAAAREPACAAVDAGTRSETGGRPW